MFFYCSSWPPVRVSRFRPFLSYIENPWAPGHISKGVVGTGGSIPVFLRGAMMHSMNFRTSNLVKTELLSKIVPSMGGVTLCQLNCFDQVAALACTLKFLGFLGVYWHVPTLRISECGKLLSCKVAATKTKTKKFLGSLLNYQVHLLPAAGLENAMWEPFALSLNLLVC